jgi:hypothetical protein
MAPINHVTTATNQQLGQQLAKLFHIYGSGIVYISPLNLLNAHHPTSSPTFSSGIPELSTSVFLEKLKSHLSRISFPP